MSEEMIIATPLLRGIYAPCYDCGWIDPEGLASHLLELQLERRGGAPRFDKNQKKKGTTERPNMGEIRRFLVQKEIKYIEDSKEYFLRETKHWPELAVEKKEIYNKGVKQTKPPFVIQNAFSPERTLHDVEYCHLVLGLRMLAISHLKTNLVIARYRGGHPMHDYGEKKGLESQARHLVGVSTGITDPFRHCAPEQLFKVIEFCQVAGAVAYDFELAKYENCLRSLIEKAGATCT